MLCPLEWTRLGGSNLLLGAGIEYAPTVLSSLNALPHQNDVLTTPANVLVLKFAGGRSHGVDRVVRTRLAERKIQFDLPKLKSDGYLLLDSARAVAADKVLFVRTPALFQLDYRDIRAFVTQAFLILKRELPTVGSLLFTLHGVKVGLDVTEVFKAQMRGILDAIHNAHLEHLQHVSVIELNHRIAAFLHDLAAEYFANIEIAQALPTEQDGVALYKLLPAAFWITYRRISDLEGTILELLRDIDPTHGFPSLQARPKDDPR